MFEQKKIVFCYFFLKIEEESRARWKWTSDKRSCFTKSTKHVEQRHWYVAEQKPSACFADLLFFSPPKRRAHMTCPS